jgi:hypothetical protein
VLNESEREQRRDGTIEIGRVTTNRTNTHGMLARRLAGAR